MQGAGEKIQRAVGSWPRVESGPHQFGAIEFCVGARHLGHVHGDALVDIPFTRAERDRLIAEGKARRHRFEPESGWVSVDLRTESDVENAIALLHLNYERATKR